MSEEDSNKEIKQLCYVSFLEDGLKASDVIEQIKEVSLKKNPQYGITGQLIFSHEIFIQVLEGKELNVDLTYRIIESDKRHSNPYILFEQFSDERCFPDWSMKFNSVKKYKSC